MQDFKTANWTGCGDLAVFEGQSKDGAWKAGNSVCAEVGVLGDKSDFLQGWEHGDARYCEPRTSLVLGRQVREYCGVCSGPLVANWLKAYKHGRLISDLVRNISRIESELNALKTIKTADAPEREANLQQPC